jgi:hypothetical protein
MLTASSFWELCVFAPLRETLPQNEILVHAKTQSRKETPQSKTPPGKTSAMESAINRTDSSVLMTPTQLPFRRGTCAAIVGTSPNSKRINFG